MRWLNVLVADTKKHSFGILETEGVGKVIAEQVKVLKEKLGECKKKPPWYATNVKDKGLNCRVEGPSAAQHLRANTRPGQSQFCFAASCNPLEDDSRASLGMDENARLRKTSPMGC